MPPQKDFAFSTDFDPSCIESLSRLIQDFHDGKLDVSPIPLDKLVSRFSDSKIPQKALSPEDYSKWLKSFIPQCAKTGSSKFIGHMTSAQPAFNESMSRLMVSLNQNPVKIETSRAMTFLERQVLGTFHRIVYHRKDPFYKKNMLARNATLGIACSGGSIANLSALWVARNTWLSQSKNTNQPVAVLISRRGHYSFGKAMDILGLGTDKLIEIPVLANHKIDLNALEEKILELKAKKIKILALIGVAGATETGSIDPLNQLALIAKREKAHFHVDAAWGGAFLLSKRGKTLLTGIEKADSVTLDAHKQFYQPMGSGILLLKDPRLARHIRHQANYIIRANSLDQGRHSLEGSRPGSALLLHCTLKLLGKKGFASILDQNLAITEHFAEKIKQHPLFELTSSPELNLLTYRYNPVQSARKVTKKAERSLSELNGMIQKIQRESGNSFVSRTVLRLPEPFGTEVCVFRCVLANPLTKSSELDEILEEQCQIASQCIKKNRKLFYPLQTRPIIKP